MTLLRTCSRTFLRCSESRAALRGVSPIVFPAYRSRAGFRSKLSRWLTPPRIMSQTTLLAFGGKWGPPSGGAAGVAAPARAIPSRWRRAPSTSPVNPMPTSDRKARRETPAQVGCRQAGLFSADGDEVIVVQEHVDEARAGAGLRGSALFGAEHAGENYQRLLALCLLLAGGRAAQDSLERRGDEVRARRRPASCLELPLDGRRRLGRAGQDHFAVRHQQRLLWHDGLMAAVALLHARPIEDGDQPEPVVAGMAVVDGSPEAGVRLGDWEVRPARLEVELPGELEEAVADHLALHATGVHPPQAAVVGVRAQVRGRFPFARGTHAVGPGEDQEAMQVLHPPARFHEFDREPVEQVGQDRPRGP